MILRFKYTTTFSLPKIACPAIVYAISVVFIGPFFVCVCPWIKVYCYNPTKIWQQRLQGVRNVAYKLCSCERSFTDKSNGASLKFSETKKKSIPIGKIFQIWKIIILSFAKISTLIYFFLHFCIKSFFQKTYGLTCQSQNCTCLWKLVSDFWTAGGVKCMCCDPKKSPHTSPYCQLYFLVLWDQWTHSSLLLLKDLPQAWAVLHL